MDFSGTQVPKVLLAKGNSVMGGKKTRLQGKERKLHQGDMRQKVNRKGGDTLRHMFSYLPVVLALLLLNGCMKVGPDYHRPDMGIQVPDSYQHAPSETDTELPEDPWWKVFRDPEIDQLAEGVLKNNLDIKKATARILEVRAYLTQAHADRFPSLNLEGQAQRERRTVIGVSSGSRSTFKSDTYSLSLPATFELDLWGRLARAEEAAQADMLQAEENRRTIAQTVVAEAISLYLEMEFLERRLQITLLSIDNYRRSMELAQSRYERGLSSILDLRRARRTKAQAEASLPPLRQNLAITQQNLAILLGRFPKASPPRLHQEDYFKRLAPVPPGLPSEILLRRPDIRTAEANLKALNARVGAAKASRFPRISLTGRFGYSSQELDQLFEPESKLWSLGAGIVQPLFDAGKLEAGQRAAEARYQQGVADYAKTVLRAFSEVERALLTRREQLERRDRILEFLTEARATQEIAETRYERGLVDYLRFQAEDNLVLVDFAILSNRVFLHRALGGGWPGENI
jgi:multidrug efflux system outer membrane protein